MTFAGHQFIKINDNWVFDITEFLGYKVTLDKDKKTVKSYKLAFTVSEDNGELEFEKSLHIPVKVMNKTKEVVKKYREEALESE